MLFLLPTDTCYGLAGELNEPDYNEIYRLKGRDFSKLLAILVEDYADMQNYIEISDEQVDFLKNYPHPWSFLGKKHTDFVLPLWMDSDKYQMLSIRVASVCLKSPPDKGGRGVSYLSYKKELTQKAQENRKGMNAPERKMWYDILHSEYINEYKFLRQKPIGSYIVDFYCQKLALVIEIDGESHIEQIDYDKKRTQFLESLNLYVLRFTNHDVMNNVEGVYAKIYEYIKNHKLTPLPPLSGGQYHFPLFLTSANLSGHPESKTLLEAKEFFPSVEGYDGGICDRPPSDIFSIDGDGELQYIRRNYDKTPE